ncbi:hypothetical protein ACQEVF_26465 [Nonomuraea polychroma]|uniref:hypothetical protein n=1 Tax=Nonomuraea polychroma TaxID=46176 RepID=UPI003D9418A0
MREIIAQTAIIQGWTARQLSTLRNTDPVRDIDREQGTSGQVWWTASLHRALTVEMTVAEVLPMFRRPGAIVLPKLA